MYDKSGFFTDLSPLLRQGYCDNTHRREEERELDDIQI